MPEFASLGAFIAFLPDLAAKLAAAERQGRQAAVDAVRSEVVTTIDGAAGGAGPFPAWAPLAAATQATRRRHGEAADAAELATGALRDSIAGMVGEDGQAAVGVADGFVGSGQPGDAVRNIGDVAVAQEQGTGHVPQRSFLGSGGFRAAEAAAAAFVTPVVSALAGRPNEGGVAHD